MSMEIDQVKIDLCDELIKERKPKWDALFKLLKELSESYERGIVVNDTWIRNDKYEPYLGYRDTFNRWGDHDNYTRYQETMTYFSKAMEYAEEAWRIEMDHLNKPRREAEIIRQVREELEQEKAKKKKTRKKSS